ncbi:MAG: M1 family metallopeptidase [Clostridia bacterium]|nr:M1 family metallopeptidase [Clostridia bacterium]
MALSGCGMAEKEARNHYVMSLAFDEEAMTLTGQQTVCYVNLSENAFDSLYFHLYPNAFASGRERSVVASNKMDEAYYDGLSSGWIDILSVCFENDNKAQYEISGEQENILVVNLQETLYPDEEVAINIDFSVKLANINHRLGNGENTINFGNFYPIACVYEEGVGFSQNPYHANGDPFYSDCSDYDVTIKYADRFSIATSGNVTKERADEENRCVAIEAENVRDFCFVLSEKFEKASVIQEGVTINYYGYKGDTDLEENVNVAAQAVQTFVELFGEYPYKQISIVKASFLNGGMEYPNLVLISDKVAAADYIYVIVHEIAHQWWYSVVGNDQYNHAWLDEGLAEYSTLLFFKQHTEYGEDFNQMIISAENSYKLFVKIYTKVNGSVDGVMDKPLCQFETEPEYVQCTYTKGVLLLDSIRQTIGDKKFHRALTKYYNEFAFKNATPADFISVFISVSGTDMEGYINSWLYDKIVW